MDLDRPSTSTMIQDSGIDVELNNSSSNSNNVPTLSQFLDLSKTVSELTEAIKSIKDSHMINSSSQSVHSGNVSQTNTGLSNNISGISNQSTNDQLSCQPDFSKTTQGVSQPDHAIQSQNLNVTSNSGVQSLDLSDTSVNRVNAVSGETHFNVLPSHDPNASQVLQHIDQSVSQHLASIMDQPSTS